MTLRTQYDAVIVGGGHNGLVAAAYLAAAGQSVLVLERDSSLGGATRSAMPFPGVDAHLSRYSYIISLFPRAIIAELGLRFATRPRAIASCTPYSRDGRPRGLLLSNVDEDRSRSSVRELAGEREWQGLHSLLALEQALAARVWPSLLEPLRTRAEWEKRFETPLEREAWEAFVERPLGEAIERRLQSDVLRGLVFVDARIGILTHPHDESLRQNRCFILHVIGNGTGEWQIPVGGMGALVDALAEAARRERAEIRVESPVLAIHPGSSRHTVVFRDGDVEREVEATRVLVNAGPQVFARLLGEEYVPSPADEGAACKVNMLLHRLPRLRAPDITPQDAFRGTLQVGQSYEGLYAAYQQATMGQVPDRPAVEMSCPTLTDDSTLGPALRRKGYHALSLFGFDAPYRVFREDEGARADYLSRYLTGLNRVLAEPIEDCLAIDAEGQPCIEILSPLDLERELALNRGNIFHQELGWFFADDPDDAGRWGVETAHERIYRCGASVVRGGGVSGIPGRNAARCVLDEIRHCRSRPAPRPVKVER